MRRDGFIATSILYSFFLVFVTLFIALVMNYLHNQVLIKKINDDSWKLLVEINNTKISNLDVGDYIKFRTEAEPNFLNGDSTWVVAYIETVGDSKIYYFLSDLTAHNVDIRYKLTTDNITKWHSTTISVYNDLRNLRPTSIYYDTLTYNKNKGLAQKIDISIPTASMMKKFRNQAIPNIKKDAIFGVDGSYVVYIDEATAGYTVGKYYEYRMYRFNEGNQAILNNYCKGTFNGSTVTYGTDNSYGYMNVMGATLNNTPYVDYCSYASPIAYTHPASDHVVTFNENYPNGDVVANTQSSVYTLRLMGKLTTKDTDANNYVSGGKGTKADPYLITNGVKP